MNLFDQQKLIFDFSFISVAVLAFYSNLFLLFPVFVVFMILIFKSNYYHKNLDHFYLDALIDFLNQVNSNLCIGMNFDAAILESSKVLEEDKSYVTKTIHVLKDSIMLGVNHDAIFDKITLAFPIEDAKLLSKMMTLSTITGANQSYIVSITIDKLYMKHKVHSEIEMILFQKKLEQMILCMAPMFIILLIKTTSSDYLNIMYSTFFGRVAMTFSFSLILIMKTISTKIVKIKI